MNRKIHPMRTSRRARTQRRRVASRPVPFTDIRITALDAARLSEPAPIVFTSEAMADIRRTVGAMPAESGGPLGGTRGSGVAGRFHLDKSSARTSVTYYPDYQWVNDLMREQWNPQGVNLLGFVHSHPAGATRPSRPDLEYATRILDGIPELDRFLLPIVQTTPDTGAFRIRGYAAVRDGERVVLEDLDVGVLPPERAVAPIHWDEFDRVGGAYDMEVMANARMVVIGTGGSAGFLEDMARAGLGEVVLIDPDIVEAPNVATQQAYRSDIGFAKVDAIARRLVDISPTIRVWTLQARLEELSDSAMRRAAVGWLPGSERPTPTATILGAFTDAFAAQARVHRLGLQFGVPVIGGAVYAEGRGVEVTFAAAGITSACIRCAQSSRYAAYLERGFRNDVGSAGAPIMATARLNALKLPIVLGLLHTVSRSARPEHPATIRFRRLTDTITDRNLVLASLDPDIHESLGMPAFAGVDGGGHDVDTTLWRRPTPDNPDTGAARCPDCGGTGDLSTSAGRFMSTIPMPRIFGEHRRRNS